MTKLNVSLKFDPPVSPEGLAEQIRLRLPSCHVSSVVLWVEDGHPMPDVQSDEGSTAENRSV